MKVSRKTKMFILILMIPLVYLIYNKTNYNNITYTTMGDGFSLGIDCYGKKTYSYNDYVKDYLTNINKLKEFNEILTEEDMTIEKLYNNLLKNQKVSLQNKKTNIKDILHETDYLVLSIGLNDLLYKTKFFDNLSYKELEKIIDEIEELFNDFIKEIRKTYFGEIYVIGYYEINSENIIYKKAISDLNKIYKSNKDVTYISSSIISENKNIFLSNPSSFYPNYKGYQAISSKIIDKIAKKLEKS